MSEIWKEITGFKGCYQASTLGRIRSLDRIVLQSRRKKTVSFYRKGKVLAQSRTKQGYCFVNLSFQGKANLHYVHRLVALTFLPNPQNKKTVNHINGIKGDNTFNNLEWLTQSENHEHAFRKGIKHHKLFAKDVIEIRSLILQGMKLKDIAKIYGVTPGAISAINTKRSWAHVE